MNSDTSFDITEPIATWSIKELIKLLECLDENSYVKLYFDGADAAIYALKEKDV